MTIQVSQNVVDTQPVAEAIPPLNINKFLPFFLLSAFVLLFVAGAFLLSFFFVAIGNLNSLFFLYAVQSSIYICRSKKSILFHRQVLMHMVN